MSQCPYSYFEYNPAAGETYTALAKRFRVDERAFREMNGDAQPVKGNVLRVPCKMGGCGRGAFYTLKKSDTLCAVAQKNGLTLEVLLDANPYLNPAYYIPGQVIVIPQTRPTNAVSLYTLGAGEGVFDVLRKFDMDLKTFASINPGLDVMQVSEEVTVNVIRGMRSGFAPCWYTVQPGDSAQRVADKFGVKLAQLLAVNENVRPSEYTPGMRVRIPTKASY